MKVVLVGPVYPYRGGIAHYTTMLYRALRERGHDVLMISFKRQYPRWLYPGKSDKDPSKQPLVVEEAKYWIDSLNPITWLLTFQRIWRYQPDVLILQWWTTFWAPVWLFVGVLNRILLRKPLVYICHNVLPHEANWWDFWLVQIVLRWGTYFIVQSEVEYKRLVALIPLAEGQIIIAPLPIYDMFADQKITKEEARKYLGLPSDIPMLLFFGFIRKYKGLQDILMAMPEIRSRIGKVILFIAGEFWEDKRLYLRIIEQLGIGDLVIIQDRYIPNEEVKIYFSAADALIAPHRQVTGSGVIQIARGFGIPVITATDGISFGDQASSPNTLADKVVCFFTKKQEKCLNAKEEFLDAPSWTHLVTTIEAIVDKA